MKNFLENLFWVLLTIVVVPFFAFAIVTYPLWYVTLKPIFYLINCITKSEQFKTEHKETILLNAYFLLMVLLFVLPTICEYFDLNIKVIKHIACYDLIGILIFTCYVLVIKVELEPLITKNPNRIAVTIAKWYSKIANLFPVIAVFFISISAFAQPTVETKEYKYIDNPACYEIIIFPTDSLQLDVWVGNVKTEWDSEPTSTELVFLGVTELVVYTDEYPYIYCTVYNKYGKVFYGELYNAAYKPKTHFFITMSRFRRDMVEYNPLDDIIPWVYKKY